jgi:hypothetical protein
MTKQKGSSINVTQFWTNASPLHTHPVATLFITKALIITIILLKKVIYGRSLRQTDKPSN